MKFNFTEKYNVRTARKILHPLTDFGPIEKARGRIQLPHEILVDVLKVDCIVAVI